MTDINTTTYLTKPNVETTRYFIPADPSTEIWIELNKKEYITDHDADITAIDNSLTNLSSKVSSCESNIESLTTRVSACEGNISTNTSNIASNTENINILDSSISTISNQVSINTSDISNLKSRLTTDEGRITTAEGNITTNTTEITNIKSQIAGLTTNPYEGLYYPVYNSNSGRAIIMFNYDKGKLLFWPINASTWSGALNNGEYTLNADVEEITIPGTIKKINQDGTTNKIINKINYMIAGDNTLLSNLKTLTTMPDVYSLSIDFTKAPNLQYFNLMEGLQVLKLSSGSINIPLLKIPSSVVECSLTSLRMYSLEFEGGSYYSNDLKLTILDSVIENKMICERRLTTDSSIKCNFSWGIGRVANYLRLDYTVLASLYDVLTFGETTQEGSLTDENRRTCSDITTLFLTGIQSEHPTLQINLHFKVIHNLIGDNHNNYTGLTADTWIGN